LNDRTVPVDGWHLADGFLAVIIIIVAFIVAVVIAVIVAAAIVAVAYSSDLVGFLIKCLATLLWRS
jgi:hypothetical protein